MSAAIPQGIDPTKVPTLAWLTFEEPATLIQMIMQLDSYWQQLDQANRNNTGQSSDIRGLDEFTKEGSGRGK